MMGWTRTVSDSLKVSLSEFKAFIAVFAMYRAFTPFSGSAAAWAERPLKVTFFEVKPLWEPRIVMVPSLPRPACMEMTRSTPSKAPRYRSSALPPRKCKCPFSISWRRHSVSRHSSAGTPASMTLPPRPSSAPLSARVMKAPMAVAIWMEWPQACAAPVSGLQSGCE